MKKLCLFLLVSSIIPSSFAVPLYQQENSRIDLRGSLCFQLQHKQGVPTDLVDNSSRISLRLTHKINENLTALGNLEMRFTDKSLGDSVYTRYLYAGFQHKSLGTLTFGKQTTNGDLLSTADYSYNLTDVKKVIKRADQVIHLTSKDFYGFKLGADYIFGASGKQTTDKNGKVKNLPNTNGYVLALFFNKAFQDWKIDVKAGFSRQRKSETNVDRSLGFGMTFRYQDFAVGLDYGKRRYYQQYGFGWRGQQVESKGKQSNAQFRQVEEWLIAAKYQLNPKSKIFAGYLWGKARSPIKNGKENFTARKLKGVILGADYKLHRQVIAFLEGAKYRYSGGESVKWNFVNNSDYVVSLGLRIHL
ncbi:porin [Rodentibacter caecimuris]|uniref:porin n=1 Tax=Rodentibacter caecimuris TaxID=1796644 RepID=UPI0022489B13|nr:porin [Rodentibacter heylii]MCX2961284.1 porin [Rodentibacter heylii]